LPQGKSRGLPLDDVHLLLVLLKSQCTAIDDNRSKIIDGRHPATDHRRQYKNWSANARAKTKPSGRLSTIQDGSVRALKMRAKRYELVPGMPIQRRAAVVLGRNRWGQPDRPICVRDRGSKRRPLTVPSLAFPTVSAIHASRAAGPKPELTIEDSRIKVMKRSQRWLTRRPYCSCRNRPRTARLRDPSIPSLKTDATYSVSPPEVQPHFKVFPSSYEAPLAAVRSTP
jgi:hypothetical protein